MRRAWVVRSEDGLDELSPAAATRVSVLDGGRVTERVISPEDFGLARSSLDGLRGGDAAENASAIVALLDGRGHPALDAVVLNAAAALALVRGDDLRACAEEARAAIDAGRAKTTLADWQRAAQRAKEPA